MKKSEFVTIMDKAIEETTRRYYRGESSYTCIRIDQAINEHNLVLHTDDFHPLVNLYAKMFKVNNKAFDVKLKHYEWSEIQKTRIAALEMFKIVMLASKKYKEIQL